MVNVLCAICGNRNQHQVRVCPNAWSPLMYLSMAVVAGYGFHGLDVRLVANVVPLGTRSDSWLEVGLEAFGCLDCQEG